MKLSTRGRYGLRMLVDLSLQEKDVVTLSSIAARQGVSVNYLEQVSKDLKRAGYVHSTKGPKGGYSLALEPKSIIIGELLRLLEGDLLITDSRREEETILRRCIREGVYNPINQALAKLYDSITLADILKDKDNT